MTWTLKYMNNFEQTECRDRGNLAQNSCYFLIDGLQRCKNLSEDATATSLGMLAGLQWNVSPKVLKRT